MDQAQDRREMAHEERPEADGSGGSGGEQRQAQAPILRQLGQVERQGVPEAGAVDPGSPPKPVRSGDFNIDRVLPPAKGEEQ